MMLRDQCLGVLAAHRGDAVVVAAYNAAFDWLRIAPHPLNYFAVGAMGQASSHGLGLAIGLPERKVIVLDGDGSLLMNLGSLVTIAAQAPDNLVHFVCENGCYEANGSHPIPGRDQVSFAGFARAAGYSHVFEFDDLGVFAKEVAGLLALRGPVFATLKVRQGEPSKLDYAAIKSQKAREEFKAALRGAPARGENPE